MTLEEFYEGLGDFALMQRHISNTDAIRRFVFMFRDDDHFDQLVEAMDAGDVETAFQCAHTIKGMCQNLCLTNVTEVTIPVVEALRSGDITLAKLSFPSLEQTYKELLWRLDELDA